MKRSAMALLVLATVMAWPLAAQTSGTSLDKEVASAELIRRAPISLKQLKADVAKLETATGKKFSLEDRTKYLDLMINDILFMQFCESDRDPRTNAKKAKIEVNDQEIAQVMQQMKAQVMNSAKNNPEGIDQATINAFATTGTISDESFFAIMQRMGVQSADLKTYMKKRLLLKKYIGSRQAEFDALVQPSYDDVSKFYQAHLKDLVRPDTVRLGVLYFETRGKSQEDITKVREKAETIYARVKGNPVKFDEQILRSKEANSGYRGESDYYYLKSPEYKSLFTEAFYTTAFSLKLNEVSGLIEGPTGFHILKANDIFPEKQLGLTDPVVQGEKTTVYDYIAQTLYNQNVNETMETMLDNLVTDIRKKAKINIKTELLAW